MFAGFALISAPLTRAVVGRLIDIHVGIGIVLACFDLYIRLVACRQAIGRRGGGLRDRLGAFSIITRGHFRAVVNRKLTGTPGVHAAADGLCALAGRRGNRAVGDGSLTAVAAIAAADARRARTAGHFDRTVGDFRLAAVAAATAADACAVRAAGCRDVRRAADFHLAP